MLITMEMEKDWIDRLQGKDMEALRWVYEQYGTSLLNLAYRILGDRYEAEDRLQELILKLPESIRSFKGNSLLGTWLYRIMHNLCLMQLGATGNRGRLLREFHAEGGLDESRIGDQAEWELKDKLNRLLNLLEPENRALLWLKEAEGLSLRELADIFSAPEGTLKARLSRSREKLKRALEENDYG